MDSGHLELLFKLAEDLLRMLISFYVSDAGDINDCYSHPCKNSGTCVDGLHNYTCQCAHLYNGTNCENDLREYGCDVPRCLNGGTCVTVSAQNYRCDCVNGKLTQLNPTK